MILRPRLLSKISEMEAIINEATVCYVGMSEDSGPYVLPMNFAFESGRVYLHADNQGHKLDVLYKNPAVCINFNIDNELFSRHKEVGCTWGMKFKSVNVHGKVRFIDDYQEKYRIMKLVMLKYSGQDYEFNEPSIRNVAVMQIDIEKLTGKVYGY
jgi:nitroimidazol reductase NimA-like FMN-containing flavoprotein (pyridoxamine 5'-phosphate oxidase superfamily)